MRPSDYLERKGVSNLASTPDRYVTNSIKSHKRPVPVKHASSAKDDPRTRGLTKKE